MATTKNPNDVILFINENGRVKRTVLTTSVQIGSETTPAELQLSGRLVLSHRSVDVNPGSLVSINENDVALDLKIKNGNGHVTVALPGSPKKGTVYYIKDASGRCSNNNIIIRGSGLIDGSQTQTLKVNYGSVLLAWSGAGWSILHATPDVGVTKVTAGGGLKGGGSMSTVELQIDDSVVATVSGTTFTGVTKHTSGLSGSLTRLTDGTSYLIAGDNVSITTGSNGAITIGASLGSGAINGSGTTGKLAKFTGTSTVGDSLLSESGTTLTSAGTAFAFTNPQTWTINNNTSALDIQRSGGSTVVKLDASNYFVGINVSPSDRLHIALNDSQTADAFTATGSRIIRLQNTNSTNGNSVSVIGADGGNQMNSYIRFVNVDHSKAGAITFGTSNSGGSNKGERVRINESGYVGIGTDNPGYMLDVNGIANVATGFRIAGIGSSGYYLRGNGTNFVSAQIVAGDVPTLNQNTTGQAGSVANSVTFKNDGTGDVATVSFNGSVARTISYNTIGAPKSDGTGASGTWGISVTGNAGTATTLQTLRSINGTSFNGSADITVPINTSQKSDNTSYNIPFVSSVTAGNQSVYTDSAADLTYNPSTNTLSTTTFSGALSGKVVLPQNTVGTSYSGVVTQPDWFIGQTMGNNDAWKIYGESPSGDNTGNLIIQAEDDADSSESIRLRFKRTYSPYTTTDALVAQFDRVYTNVNVGVGTTNPTQKLQIGSIVDIGSAPSTAAPDSITLGSTYSNAPGVNLKLRLWETTVLGSPFYSGLGISAFAQDYSVPASWNHIFYIGGAEKIRFDSSGNIGIGTTDPSSNSESLTLYRTSSQSVIGVYSDTAKASLALTGYKNSTPVTTGLSSTTTLGAVGTETNHPLALIVNNSEKVRIMSAGNVGIGVTTTTDKLAVNGKVSITGSLFPGADSSHNIGDPTKKWDYVYANNLVSYASFSTPNIFTTNVYASNVYADNVSETYLVDDVGGSTTWVKLGTYQAAQGGRHLFIKVVTSTGYNANPAQQSEVHIHFKTSNGTSVDSNGFAGDATFYVTNAAGGYNVKVKGDFAGTSATTYEIWLQQPAYNGKATYTVEYPNSVSGTTWTHVGTTGSDPGSASSTVCVASQRFLVQSNVGIGTTNPLQLLQVGSVGIGSTSSPAAISLGGTYSDGAGGSNLKLRLLDNGSGLTYGLGISTLQMDYAVPALASHVWYINNTETTRINSDGIMYQKGKGVFGFNFGSTGGVVLEPSTTYGKPAIQSISSAIAMDTLLLNPNGGSIGIGTTNPAALLEVSGSLTGARNANLRIGIDLFGVTSVNTSKASGHVWYHSNDAQRMIIDSAGYVGIGSASPNAQLDITGGSSGVPYTIPTLRLRAATNNGYGYIQFGDSSTGGNNWHIGNDTDASFRFYNGTFGSAVGERVRITSGGDVGINTISPGARLDVNGKTRFRDDAGVDAGKYMYFGREESFGGSDTGGSDYGYLLFNNDDNNYNYWGDSSENSSFVIGCENDANNSVSDVLVLKGKAANIFDSSSGINLFGGVGSSPTVGIGTTNPTQLLQVGSIRTFAQGWVASTAPATITLGTTFSSVAGQYPKLRLFDSPADGVVNGFGVSSGQIDYIAAAGVGHVFHIGGAEKLRIDSSGNVGIGTTDPTANTEILRMYKSTQAIVGLYSDTGKASFIARGYGSTTPVATGVAANSTSGAAGTGTNHPFILVTNDSERMRIDATGSIGIGSTAPAAKLDIIGTSGMPELRLRQSATSGYAYIQLGTSTTSTNNWHFGSEGDGNLVYWNGNWGSGAEKVRITSAGRVGIGTNNPTNAILHVNGVVAGGVITYPSFGWLRDANPSSGWFNDIFNFSYLDCSIYASDRIISETEFNALSDYRAKDIQRRIEVKEGLRFIEEINPVIYTWKSDKKKEQKYGFIAQDVLKAGFVSLVGIQRDDEAEEYTDEDGFTSPKGGRFVMCYDNIVPLLTAAMKGLKAENDSLKSELQSLKDQISSIMSMLNNK